MSFRRGTTLANALCAAVAKEIKTGKVDHHTGQGNWIARRVLISSETRPHLGIVTEYDKRPSKSASK